VSDALAGAVKQPGAVVTLVAQPLEPVAFAPFGTVVAVPAGAAADAAAAGRSGVAGRPINGGTSLRFDLLDDLHLTAAGGRPMLAVFRAQPRTFPFTATELESHRLGSQAFLPLGGLRFAIVVAPPGPAPDLRRIVAFVTDGHQGIVLAPGTWHHALLAVNAGDVAVIERTAGEVDCDVAVLASPVQIELPPVDRR
jgi:ureidoglycolate lyase